MEYHKIVTLYERDPDKKFKTLINGRFANVGVGTLDEAVSYVKSRPMSTWGQFEMEGIVARPVVELLDSRGNRIITKLKCRDFAEVA